MRNLWLLVSMVLLVGCMTVRTYSVEKPRVDTDIQGNRGYLTGTSKDKPKKSRLKDTRTVSVIEIEFGSQKVRRARPRKDTAIEETFLEEETEFIEEKFLQKEDKYYTVQKKDTLQKISSKFYGTTKKWKMLYNANTDVLKNPNKVYPGMKIKIPALN